jgi:hypothetical protein
MPKPEQGLLYTCIVAVMLMAAVATAHVCVNALWRCASVPFLSRLFSAALVLAVVACVDAWVCGCVESVGCGCVDA